MTDDLTPSSKVVSLRPGAGAGAPPAAEAAAPRSFAALLSRLRNSNPTEPPVTPQQLTGMRSLLAAQNRPCDEDWLLVRISALLGHYYTDQERSDGEWGA